MFCGKDFNSTLVFELDMDTANMVAALRVGPDRQVNVSAVSMTVVLPEEDRWVEGPLYPNQGSFKSPAWWQLLGTAGLRVAGSSVRRTLIRTFRISKPVRPSVILQKKLWQRWKSPKLRGLKQHAGRESIAASGACDRRNQGRSGLWRRRRLA